LLIGATLVAACHFAVDGLSNGGGSMTDLGIVGMIGGDPDLAVGGSPVDLAGGTTPADLATPPPDLTSLPSNIGDPCSGACGGGLICATFSPAGYCTQTCGVPNPCPSGTSCVDVGMGMHYCLVNYNGGCQRSDLNCRDCGQDVCAPLTICGGC
jgi:hypothetical protein